VHRKLFLPRSRREGYGDNAVEYVQIKRDGDICTVNARGHQDIILEKKTYSVELLLNESEENIFSV
jgi:hypothetical protein